MTMTPSDTTHEASSEDLMIAQLLQRLGARDRPALPLSAQIEAVVRAETAAANVLATRAIVAGGHRGAA